MLSASRRMRRIAGFAVLASAGLIAGPLAAAPAQALTHSHPIASPVTQYGRTVTVDLHGKSFTVQLNRPSGVMPQHGAGAHPLASRFTNSSTYSTYNTVYPPTIQTSGLYYGGGPLETSPVIYLDFWGSQWDSDTNGVESYMTSLFNGLGAAGDNWSPITSQYTDYNGNSPTFSGSVLGGTWVDDAAPAPASASQSQLAAEADNAASYFGVSGPNADVFVLSPSGTQPDGFPNAGFCAWHDWSGTVAYTNMPYVLDAGASCGANSVQNQLDGFSIVGGHEYAEAITDPEPSSGYTDSNGYEIGDLCAWDNDQTVTLSTGTFAMQPLYSNYDNGCVFSAP